MDEGSITVNEGIDNKKRTTDLKTSSSFRKIYIDKKLSHKLNTQRKWQFENRLLFGTKYKLTDYVFTHEDGSFIIPHRLGFAFKALINHSGLNLPVISIYGARHSFASNAIAAGVEPSVVANILGHSTISTTYDNYVHVKPEPIRDASTLMYNIIAQ